MKQRLIDARLEEEGLRAIAMVTLDRALRDLIAAVVLRRHDDDLVLGVTATVAGVDVRRRA